MLRFIWLRDYKNIKSRGFSFDPTLEATYDSDKGELLIEENSALALPANFFGDNITSVTGVLGENGAGKSTLMEAIMQSAGSFSNGSSHNTPECLFIFGKTILHESSITLTNVSKLEEKGYSVYGYTDSISYLSLLRAHKIGQAAPTYGINDPVTEHGYIYYANFWETPWLYPAPGVIDVSTANLFEDIRLRNKNLRDGQEDPVEVYRTRNFIWEIRTLSYLRISEAQELPFSLPRLLSLYAKEPKDVYQAELDDAFFEANQAQQLKKWPQEYANRIQNAAQESAFEEFLARFILPRLLVLLRVYPEQFKRLSDEELSGLSSLRSRPPRVNGPQLAEQLSDLYSFVTFLREENEKGNIFPSPEREQYGQAPTRVIRLDISAVPQEKLEGLFTSISYMPNGAQTFDAYWAGLSSGQMAYLRIYARLYQALTRVIERNEVHHQNYKTLTILIDEGETGFHPQWQKKYIQLLLNIIEQVFANFPVQLIVGSNSAFIASDIPQSNLLLLHRRASDGQCQVTSWAGKEQTFAANIHTLFTESFFLQDGLMGDFARFKVGELIQYLQHEATQQDDNRAEMRAIMDMIGEPVIRMKLQEMWNEKFGPEERIAELQKEIDELRRQQNNG